MWPTTLVRRVRWLPPGGHRDGPTALQPDAWGLVGIVRRQPDARGLSVHGRRSGVRRSGQVDVENPIRGVVGGQRWLWCGRSMRASGLSARSAIGGAADCVAALFVRRVDVDGGAHASEWAGQRSARPRSRSASVRWRWERARPRVGPMLPIGIAHRAATSL